MGRWPETCSFFEHAEDAPILAALCPRWTTKKQPGTCELPTENVDNSPPLARSNEARRGSGRRPGCGSLDQASPRPEQISTTLRAPRITAAGVSSVLPSA